MMLWKDVLCSFLFIYILFLIWNLLASVEFEEGMDYTFFLW